MKKTYLQPTMMVVTLQQHSIICTSPLSDVSTNLTGDDAIGYGGGSSTQSARVKGNAVDWDDDWSE